MRIRSLIVLSPMLLVGLFALQCRQSSKPHAVLGEWEAGDLVISFYDDGVASMHGVRARWRAIDDSSVRIEVEKAVMEFAVSRSSAGELKGTLSRGGQEWRDSSGMRRTYRRGRSAEQTATEDIDKEAQRRTVADIKNVGTAIFSWITDQVSLGVEGKADEVQSGNVVTTLNLTQHVKISRADLEKILVPAYIQEVPENDGWGHPYEFYLKAENPLAARVACIRSPGRDGEFDATDYTIKPFPLDHFYEDIVWADGFFARWPQAPSHH